MSDKTLAVLQPFQITTPDHVREVIRENLGGEGITRFDLSRVRVPGPGSNAWEIPSPDGPKPVREFDAVIVFVKGTRRWYRDAYQPGTGRPPDCYSDDLISGIGDPGGPCTDCPHNQWGTAINAQGQPTRGKECGEYRLLFAKLKGGGLLPTVVVIPPSSLKSVREYLINLSDWAIPYYGVVTRFTLEKSDPVSIVRLSRVEALPPEAVAEVRAYAEGMRRVLGAVELRPEDVA